MLRVSRAHTLLSRWLAERVGDWCKELDVGVGGCGSRSVGERERGG
jgi:hypothetical protein